MTQNKAITTHITAAMMLLATILCARGEISVTARGAIVETDRYKAVFNDAALTGFVNKFHGEEYLDPYVDMDALKAHLPSGLGTQNTDAEREAAFTLFKWPWWEHPAASTWPNQHYPDSKSVFTTEELGENHIKLVYTGLTDGTKRFADEKFSLELKVEEGTLDLLVTPIAQSPRKGVYASALTVAALGPAITAEAPIFDGLRLDRNMQPMLWVNQWGGFWDYAFIAFNGYKRGSVAVWTQDAQLKYYKYLFYLINQEGLSFSFTGMNIPPFDNLTEAAPLVWRIQAFEKDWSEAAARFRDWRLANVDIAPRADWTKKVSFVDGGVTAGGGWLNYLSNYMGGSNLTRCAYFGATIRGEGFDRNHANNTPYEGLKEDMKLWKEKGAKMMAYLQPMIMWGARPKNEREEKAVEYSKEANTIMVFQGKDAKTIPYVDQHHLGQAQWQRWFLDWVKEYIQVYGVDGVYHDQSYHCPVDSRGLAVNNMTTTEGMADYFRKAQNENPNSIHGTEHMTEVNNVGASLGIGSGILWGTAESMRRQRIDHPSPICNALHYPNGVIFSFPHYSQVTSRMLQRIHWGMNIMEGRGEIPYAALQGQDAAQTEGLANERWLDVVRNHTFVHRGLRPTFPTDWSRDVISYFHGAEGEDFRYTRKVWGSAFVEIDKNGKEAIWYGRIHGVPNAVVAGGIEGWACYREDGPAGLNPSRYYVLNPSVKRPAVYFMPANPSSPSFYEAYVDEGFADDTMAVITLKPREDLLNIITYDSLIVHASTEPKAFYINGSPTKLTKVDGTDNQWKASFQLTEKITLCAIVGDVSEGFGSLAEQTIARTVGLDWAMDQMQPARGSPAVKSLPNGLSTARNSLLTTLRAPTRNGAGVLRLKMTAKNLDELQFNGKDVDVTLQTDAKNVKTRTAEIPLQAGEYGVLVLKGLGIKLETEWNPDTAQTPEEKTR